MKRIWIVALTAGAVTAAGIGIHKAESAGHRGDHRGSHAGDGYGGGYGHGRGWGRKGRRGRHGGMRRMMKRYDANGDRQLTQEEVTNGRKALITKHDADGNGKLSLAEFEKLWLEVRRRRMVRSFQRWDEDGDASITIEEYVAPYANFVERMDRNEDGVIDKKDRKRRWGKRHRRHGKKHDRNNDND